MRRKIAGKLLVLCLFLSAIAKHSEQLAPGILYTHIKKENPYPTSLHIVEIKKDAACVCLEHAFGNGTDRETVSSIGKRTDALVAINAGNYRRGGQFNGNSVGFLKIKEKIYADPNIHRALLFISNDDHIFIEQGKCIWSLQLGNTYFPIHKINQPRGKQSAIIYNRAFRKTTLTNNEGTEIVISQGKIIAISHNEGNTPIPKDGFVYSIEKTSDINLGNITIGMPAQLSYTLQTLSSENLSNIDYAVTGAGILIKNGKIVDNFHEDLQLGIPIIHSGDEIAADFHNDKERMWLIEERHPRSALGIKTDQSLILLVVDGRQPNLSIGMTFAELADYLYSLGCVDAINIGGGGCSTLYIKDRIVNSPAVQYDSQRVNTINCNERPVSDALLIFAHDQQ